MRSRYSLKVKLLKAGFYNINIDKVVFAKHVTFYHDFVTTPSYRSKASLAAAPNSGHSESLSRALDQLRYDLGSRNTCPGEYGDLVVDFIEDHLLAPNSKASILPGESDVCVSTSPPYCPLQSEFSYIILHIN